MNPVEATNLAATSDLSLLGLFLQADWVVKGVIVLLLLASIWVWAIVFEKTTALRRANKAADAFEDRFWSGGSLDDLYDTDGKRPTHPVAAVFGAAMGEWQRSAKVAGADMTRGSVRDRVDRTVNVTVQREMDRMERWMVFLASVGSVGTFIGLFGTVWGIMHAFQAIALQKNTNLSVVAPSIAEALFATAIGLAAAIPAYIAYNKFSTDASKFQGRLESFADDLLTAIARRVAGQG